jgi:hypothetical protein
LSISHLPASTGDADKLYSDTTVCRLTGIPGCSLRPKNR